jgi:hypothetical protein
VAKNSLQGEFWREVDARRLPRTDAVERVALKLEDPTDVGTSVFLHRLRVAGIPYAGFQGTQALTGPRKRGTRAPQQNAGGLDALQRTNEVWEAQWTPSTDVALIERIVLGSTLEEVVARVLEGRLETVKTAGEAADVVYEAVVTGTGRTVGGALSVCDRLASEDDDLPSLSHAASQLSFLVSYRSSGARAALGGEAVPVLCEKTFARAVLRVPHACTGTDEAVEQPLAALRRLHDLALTQPRVDRDAWLAAAGGLVRSYAVNPGASGLAAGLLYLAQVLSDDDVALVVGQRLSDTLEPARAASFLWGFFAVNTTAIVKSRPVVAALDAFLGGIDPARFRDVLPVLRRAFGALGATERRYLLENVIGARKIGDKARAAQAVLLEKDKEKLKAMSADLSKAMDDLDDLL